MKQRNYKEIIGMDRAPRGFIYVCMACGLTSRDAYGKEATKEGWTDNCSFESALVRKSLIVYREDGTVEKVKKAIREEYQKD